VFDFVLFYRPALAPLEWRQDRPDEKKRRIVETIRRQGTRGARGDTQESGSVSYRR
jgi:hypothetical protein